MNNTFTNGPVYMLIVIIITAVVLLGMGLYYTITDYLNGALTDEDMSTYTKGEQYEDLALSLHIMHMDGE